MPWGKASIRVPAQIWFHHLTKAQNTENGVPHATSPRLVELRAKSGWSLAKSGPTPVSKSPPPQCVVIEPKTWGRRRAKSRGEFGRTASEFNRDNFSGPNLGGNGSSSVELGAEFG